MIYPRMQPFLIPLCLDEGLAGSPEKIEALEIKLMALGNERGCPDCAAGTAPLSDPAPLSDSAQRAASTFPTLFSFSCPEATNFQCLQTLAEERWKSKVKSSIQLHPLLVFSIYRHDSGCNFQIQWRFPSNSVVGLKH